MANNDKFAVSVTGSGQAAAALRKIPKELRAATAPVMNGFAQQVQKGARAGAQKHPSGLWKSSKGRSLIPRYTFAEKGTFYYQVRVPGGAVGKAESITEFAKVGHTPAGKAMVAALDDAYGHRSGGRVLWKAYDDGLDKFLSDIDKAVSDAAAKVDGGLNG